MATIETDIAKPETAKSLAEMTCPQLAMQCSQLLSSLLREAPSSCGLLVERMPSPLRAFPYCSTRNNRCVPGTLQLLFIYGK